MRYKTSTGLFRPAVAGPAILVLSPILALDLLVGFAPVVFGSTSLAFTPLAVALLVHYSLLSEIRCIGSSPGRSAGMRIWRSRPMREYTGTLRYRLYGLSLIHT